ncbi:hypothetical protein [Streptosporangium sp. NPDC049046]|uniref:hypothetical protein n=1 Tax=Streptosporangium sp. NPDC049046 TaxID=3155031 RepID=UPI0034224B6D
MLKRRRAVATRFDRLADRCSAGATRRALLADRCSADAAVACLMLRQHPTEPCRAVRPS